jgi:hypothetical protein
MNRKSTVPIPEAITQLLGQLEQFRSTRPARTKLPESLWQAAVELARQHGIYAVAHPLRLDYTRLKQRVFFLRTSPEFRAHFVIRHRHLPESNGPASPISLASYGWQKHCRGLYQTPIAA